MKTISPYSLKLRELLPSTLGVGSLEAIVQQPLRILDTSYPSYLCNGLTGKIGPKGCCHLGWSRELLPILTKEQKTLLGIRITNH